MLCVCSLCSTFQSKRSVCDRLNFNETNCRWNKEKVKPTLDGTKREKVFTVAIEKEGKCECKGKIKLAQIAKVNNTIR